MNLKIIETKTLEKVKERIALLLEKSEKLSRHLKKEEWLDNQDVCRMLNISQRTLQNYRDRGILSYSMIGHKCYYKAGDISLFVESSKDHKPRKEKTEYGNK